MYMTRDNTAGSKNLLQNKPFFYHPIKIVYFITDLKLAGAQKVLMQVVINLDKEKYQPIVVCLFGSNTPIKDDKAVIKKNKKLKAIALLTS